jgi:hypothetical protein
VFLHFSRRIIKDNLCQLTTDARRCAQCIDEHRRFDFNGIASRLISKHDFKVRQLESRRSSNASLDQCAPSQFQLFREILLSTSHIAVASFDLVIQQLSAVTVFRFVASTRTSCAASPHLCQSSSVAKTPQMSSG